MIAHFSSISLLLLSLEIVSVVTDFEDFVFMDIKGESSSPTFFCTTSVV